MVLEYLFISPMVRPLAPEEAATLPAERMLLAMGARPRRDEGVNDPVEGTNALAPDASATRRVTRSMIVVLREFPSSRTFSRACGTSDQ
jgi:hypothetical protein